MQWLVAELPLVNTILCEPFFYPFKNESIDKVEKSAEQYIRNRLKSFHMKDGELIEVVT